MNILPFHAISSVCVQCSMFSHYHSNNTAKATSHYLWKFNYQRFIQWKWNKIQCSVDAEMQFKHLTWFAHSAESISISDHSMMTMMTKPETTISWFTLVHCSYINACSLYLHFDTVKFNDASGFMVFQPSIRIWRTAANLSKKKNRQSL